MDNQPGFFDFAAEVGLTKHIGGLEATEALIELCHIGTVRSYAVNTKDETRGILRWYGLGGMLGVMGRMLLLYARSLAYRKFVKGVRQGEVTPKNLEEYFGYGLFVGRKCVKERKTQRPSGDAV